MKNVLTTCCLIVFSLFGINEAFSCGSITNAAIAGPSGYCVATGTPITYTGTHNFSSSGCTIYEWTVTNGTVTGPGGVSVTNGTLCIVENAVCLFDISFDCDDADLDNAVASGSGANVTVVWASGVQTASLRLKAREVGERSLSASTTINIDHRPVPLTYISRTNVGSSSSTFRANSSIDACPGTIVSWTVNGNSAGVGNPRTLSVGQCASATVCATATLNGYSSAQICQFFGSDPIPGTISGSEEIPIYEWRPYTFSGASNVDNTQWYVNPSSNGQVIGSGANASLILFNPNASYADLCVSGTWGCGEYNVCKRVFIASPPQATDEHATVEQSSDQEESNQRNSISNLNVTSNASELSIYPSPIEKGSELTIRIPDYGQMVDVAITDIQGRTVYQNRTDQIELKLGTQNFPKGLYLVSVTNEKGTETEKLIVQ